MRPHRLLISCAAAGALALGPSAAALAHGHSQHGGGGGRLSAHGHTHVNKHGADHGNGHGRGHDRLAGPRNAAGHALKAQAVRIARMLANITVGDALTDSDQGDLLAALQSDLAALTADLGAVQEATNVHQLNAIKHAAVLTATIAGRQVGIVAEADAVKQHADELAGTLSDLATQVAIAADMGQPMGAAQAALEDAMGQLAAAGAAAQDAIDTILAVSPTGSRGDLNGACDAAGQALLDAQNALAGAAADVVAVNAALGN
jgi:hypothetical protein